MTEPQIAESGKALELVSRVPVYNVGCRVNLYAHGDERSRYSSSTSDSRIKIKRLLYFSFLFCFYLHRSIPALVCQNDLTPKQFWFSNFISLNLNFTLTFIIFSLQYWNFRLRILCAFFREQKPLQLIPYKVTHYKLTIILFNENIFLPVYHFLIQFMT